ncbi:aminotransferase class I/II-fold pyridoxal phosphate-dependent enzyme [Oceanobacillus alkalisoli]|uniref:aminotransferase class I/II-fold pyridoxal phosphate-dependent enzyme n=1 Tax=Oceanobacillus alkalisoli TaxID=2925113 RepID=UPI001EF05204|nr:aminotransferase class I/II-fold pyridoxal phosphate-dependent enzyme [Oceanobacillus alkalisoli]MCF3944068.1 aminotransferase class I/II-fold pyridoxal phosphate-dependent enzyme [Oceanobacillus alkalisoli]MCG5103341.1 aminotransferase class I/II-fold pyridoxal phosphate-dependent enzyme [Oceanobacillus alkalisoli]
MKQKNIPILKMLDKFTKKNPLSFHVPGHKNGTIFPEQAQTYYEHILKLDVTELPGLDDLHAPQGSIAEAEKLATKFFQSDHTFFLINGSTVGNLAMILATCKQGDKVIVQRNCHKSIMNGLELAGVRPIFIAPDYDAKVQRFTSPALKTFADALSEHPDAAAVILTYPDYFGRTYNIKAMIELAHKNNIPVLVDEAHGVHFSLGNPFPSSSLTLGADVVVHSAHKTAPAMTMASYLHIKSTRVTKECLAYRLQMLQSSSPSYPLMASLDIARYFLANQTEESIQQALTDVQEIKALFAAETYDKWELVPSNDPIKLTIQLKDGYTAKEAATLFEAQGIYPELVTERQILFIFGLASFTEWNRLKKVLDSVNEKLKNEPNHATIEVVNLFTSKRQELALSYRKMEGLEQKLIPLEASNGEIAAEAVIPYPPGIPFILKGEMVTHEHIRAIRQLTVRGVRIQQRNEGIRIFKQ